LLKPVGFWSYARQDDNYRDGDLSQLRTIVGKAISSRQGEEVTLWQDTVAIPFGADWAANIEDAIRQVTFFIPVLTPAFLKSKNCLDEFEMFRRRMADLGRDDLIFPIHYVDVERIAWAETVFGDELAALRRQQWIDFRPLSFEDLKSPKVRQWADALAMSVLGALQRLSEAQPTRSRPDQNDLPLAEGVDATAIAIHPPANVMSIVVETSPAVPGASLGAAAPDAPAGPALSALNAGAAPRESVETGVASIEPLSPERRDTMRNWFSKLFTVEFERSAPKISMRIFISILGLFTLIMAISPIMLFALAYLFSFILVLSFLSVLKLNTISDLPQLVLYSISLGLPVVFVVTSLSAHMLFSRNSLEDVAAGAFMLIVFVVIPNFASAFLVQLFTLTRGQAL
jgi:hypothetical protein